MQPFFIHATVQILILKLSSVTAKYRHSAAGSNALSP